MHALSDLPRSEVTRLADSHRKRLCDALRLTPPTTLVSEFIPAERARWESQTPALREILGELYRQLGSELDELLPVSYPGELRLAKLAWHEQMSGPADKVISWPGTIMQLRHRLEALKDQGQFHHYPLSSDNTWAGALVTRVRRLGYRIAASLGIRTAADQQQAFNATLAEILVEVKEMLDTVERMSIENDRAITQLIRRVADLERRAAGDNG